MAMPDQTVTAIGELEILHGSEEGLRLHLDSLRQKLAGARSQNTRQGIIDLIGLTKASDVDSLIHGVSLSREVLAGSTPASIRRPSHSVITHIPA
jgi:hypothetical protein